MQITNIKIDIGVLWNETDITGELTGEFDINVTTPSGRNKHFTLANCNFRARTPPSHRERTFGIRLEESLSEKRAQEHLASALNISKSFKGDVIEAGVRWSDDLDGRVWWPVLAAGSSSDAKELLHDLREKTTLEPLGLSIIPIEGASRIPFFSPQVKKNLKQLLSNVSPERSVHFIWTMFPLDVVFTGSEKKSLVIADSFTCSHHLRKV